jgi:hypothetical protein
MLLAAVLSPAAAQQNYKAEAIGECTAADLDPAVKSALNTEGVRVTGPDGAFCEIWLRKSIPQKSAGGEYTTLANSVFTGVIVYSQKGGDYRGQGIKPGTYLMRYQSLPQDGNHMGVAPTKHFFLLSPASEDKDPAATPDYKTLIAMSRKAAGTNHPVTLWLTKASADPKPAVRSLDEGHWAVELKTKAQPAGGAETDLPVAIILVGKSEA